MTDGSPHPSFRKKPTTKRQKQRRSVGMQLVVGEDDDLLAWYQDMQANDISVNAWLKQMIRERLAAGRAAPPSPAEHTDPPALAVVMPLMESHHSKLEYLNEQLETLKHQITTHPTAVHDQVPSEHTVSATTTAWMQAQEDQLAHLVRQFQRLETALQQLSQTPSPVDTQTLDAQRAHKRKTRLAKNSW